MLHDGARFASTLARCTASRPEPQPKSTARPGEAAYAAHRRWDLAAYARSEVVAQCPWQCRVCEWVAARTAFLNERILAASRPVSGDVGGSRGPDVTVGPMGNGRNGQYLFRRAYTTRVQ